LLKKTVEAAAIAHVRSHDLRHTYASHLVVDLRLDVVQVQRQLGHSRPSITTDIYTGLIDPARHAEQLRQMMASSEFGALLTKAEVSV
jgi:integrase